jgi:hypothetical protein
MIIELQPGYHVVKSEQRIEYKKKYDWEEGMEFIWNAQKVEVEKFVYDFNENSENREKGEKEPAWMRIGFFGEDYYSRRGTWERILEEWEKEDVEIDNQIYGELILSFQTHEGSCLFMAIVVEVGHTLMPMGWYDMIMDGRYNGNVEGLVEDLENCGVVIQGGDVLEEDY